MAAAYVDDGSASQQPLAVLAVTRPVDRAVLATIGSYAGVRVTPAPQDVAERFITATTPPPASNGVLNQFGETFTQGSRRSAYLGVYDVDGFRSGLVQVLDRAERRHGGGRGDPHGRAGGPGGGARGGLIAALLVSRRISTPLRELAAAAVGMAGGRPGRRST